MKYLTYAALITGTAFAQPITGVSVLKGTLKTKVMVRGTSSTCKVKISKIRNIMEEDSFGYPGYRVTLEADVEGRNDKQELVVNYHRNFSLSNFWEEGGKVVAKDFEYASTDGALLTIKEDGRLKSLSFPVDNDKLTCSF
jgi:hypothetical protein